MIRRHPNVHDVAVIGVPDSRLGEAVAAVIDPLSSDSLTVEEMRAFCEKNLPRYKRPRVFIFDHVPRSGTRKIEKPKLREKHCRGNG